MEIKKIENYNVFFKKVFLFTFCLELIVRLIGIYSLLPSRVDTFLFTLTSIFGIVILFIDFFILKKISIRGNILLFLFLFALVLSTILNGPIGFMANIKLIIWQIIYLFVVFQIGSTMEMQTCIKLLEKIIIITWDLLSTISVMMFFVHFSYVAPLDKFYNGLRVGFVENRLYGIFADPNFAGTISVVIIVFSVYYLFSEKNTSFIKFSRIFSILIQFIYIVLSGSRTAFIALIVVSFCGAFFSYNKIKTPKSFFSYITCLLVSIAVLLCIVGGESAVKIVFPKLAENVPTVNFFIENSSGSNKEDLTLTRDDVENKEDVSNNRFELWESSFDIFKTTPIVGTSPRNLLSYAMKHLPNTFISTKRQTSHNFFFYLLATTGLLGTIPMISFITIKVLGSLRILLTANFAKYDRFLMENLVCLAILISAIFLTELILVNKIGAFLFWLYLGKITNISNQIYEEKGCKI